MKYIRQINEFLESGSQGRPKFQYYNEELKKYLISEIRKQGKDVVIKDLDVSNRDLHGLFRDITDGVESLDLSGWKTSRVYNMSNMFYGCDSLVSLNLSGWDTSKVRNMTEMFRYCVNLKSLDLSGWDTSNVKDMGYMFWNCYHLESLDISGWDTSNVEDMDYMFRNCPAPYKVVSLKKDINICGVQF